MDGIPRNNDNANHAEEEEDANSSRNNVNSGTTDADGDLDALRAWSTSMANALDRRAPLAEIRSLVLDALPTRYQSYAFIGHCVLKCLLSTSRSNENDDDDDDEDEDDPPRRRRRRRSTNFPSLPMIKFLVEKVRWGKAILWMNDGDGHVALHVALIHQAPSHVIRYLVRQAPEAVRRRAAVHDEYGFYPIHLAVDRHRHPQTGEILNDHAIVPTHWDTFDMYPWDVVQCLLDAWPESIQQTSGRGWTVLHHALRHLHQNRAEDRRVVHKLIERWPESLSWQTQDGYQQLAIHVAMNEAVPVRDIQYMLRAYPQAIEATTSRGYLPLHLAFVRPDGTARRYGFSDLPTLRFLVQQDPSALLQETCEGLLPLHLAFVAEDWQLSGNDQLAPTLEEIRCLVDACPESVHQETGDHFRKGWTALFFAVSNPRTSPDVLRFIMDCHPESVLARERSGARRMPLHVAVESDLSVASIEALIRAGPEALKAWTTARRDPSCGDGGLPIHQLAERGESRKRWRTDPRHGSLLDALQCLLRHDPDSVRETTRGCGKTVLHLVLEALFKPPGYVDEAVEYLLELWPEAVRVATIDKSWLPLHCAADRGRTPGVIGSLLNLYPDAARHATTDAERRLPIHMAASNWLTPAPSLELLLDAWLDSAFVACGKGWLPIHYAIAHGGTPERIRCLLQRHPETTRSMTTGDGYLPVHLAANREYVPFRSEPVLRARKLDLVRVVVEHDRELLLARSTRSRSLPLHLAVSSNLLDENVVEYMVEQCPESVRCRDGSGSLPVHCALKNDCYYGEGHLHRVAEILVDSHPDSLLVADAQGFLPVHLAAASKRATVDVVFMLLRRRPDSIAAAADLRSGGGVGGIDDDDRILRQRSSPQPRSNTTKCKRRRLDASTP